MKTVVIDTSARRITIRRVEGVVNGRNDCEDSELPGVFLAKQARFAKRNCTLGKVSHSKEEHSVTNGLERKGKQISFSRGDVARSSADDGKTQSSASSSSGDGNLSRKLTALERLKNLSFDTPQVRLQSLVSEKAHKPSRVATEVPTSSAGDRLLLESAHGRSRQSPYRRSDNVHRPTQDGRRRDDAHCTLSSSDYSSSRSGSHRYDQQSSYAKRSHSTGLDQRLSRSYNGYYMSRPNATCSDMDFSIFHSSADVAAIRETVFNWEKLSSLEFDESDLSACTRTELEVVAKFVLLRRASLNRSTAIMADEVSALQEAVETQKRWCDVLKCNHMYPHSSSTNQCKLPNKTDDKHAKTASSTIDRESNQAAARLAASLAKQAQARTQALPSSHDAQMNSLCNAFFNGMISAMLDRINGKEKDSIA